MIATTILALAAVAAPQSSGGGALAPVGVKSNPAIRCSGSASALSITRVEFGATITESAPLLSGAKLLAIDISGRTPLSDAAADLGKVIEVAAGVQAVQLPGPAAIRIFHYQKPQSKSFGFFALRGKGEFELLIERSGLGDNGTVDPFDPVIGVSRDGKTIAIAASEPNQGVQGLGDTWLIRCDGQPLANGSIVRELTGAANPDVQGVSLQFFGTSLVAVLGDALGTAPANGSAGFTTLNLPATGGGVTAEVTSEMVISADGKKLAVLAGADEDNLDIYVLGIDGSVTNVTMQPQPLVTPEFLPESAEGPLFALSPDGSTVTYQVDEANGNELFTSTTAAGAVPIHLTPDPVFDQSIDQMSGILTGGSFTRFLAASGQLNADLYRVTLPSAGVPTLSNLTLTSGANQPFFPNTATMQVSAQSNLRGGRLLVDDRTQSAAGYDLWFNTNGDTTGIALTGLDQPATVIAPGVDAKNVAITARQGAQSYLMSFDGNNAPRNLIQLPQGASIASVAVRDGGTVFAASVNYLGLSFVIQLAASGAALNIVQGSPFSNARSLLYGRDQRLMFVATVSGSAQTYFVNALQQAVPAGSPAPVAFWLR